MSSTIPWTQVKALSFDIYGTLVDWEKGMATAALATSLGPYLPQIHQELMDGIHKHEYALHRETPTMLQTKVTAEALRRMAQDLKVVQNGYLTEDQVEEATQEYAKHMGDVPAFPDTVAAIQSLGRRYKLIPLSNVDHASFNRTLFGSLKECHFDAIYLAEDIGSYKPDLQNFHYLLEHMKSDLGIDKQQLCHVARSLVHDHAPTKQMDIQSVWVDRGVAKDGDEKVRQEKYGYQLRVETLGELAEIVERAFSKAS